MKKLVVIILALLFCIPQIGSAQYLSVDNFTVYVGGEYARVNAKVKGPPGPSGDGQDINRLNIRPHFKLSYTIPFTNTIQASVFSGYSQLGGVNRYSNNSTEYQNNLRIQSIHIGLRALIKFNAYKAGPVFSWYKVLGARFQRSKRVDGNWNTIPNVEDVDNVLADESMEVGFTVQRKINSHFTVSLEGLYGLEDIYFEERHFHDVLYPNFQWYPQHYRLSIGYSL